MHQSRNKYNQNNSLQNQNDQIAQIYQKIQHGNNQNAIKQLNNVKNTKTLLAHNPHKITSHKQIKTNNNNINNNNNDPQGIIHQQTNLIFDRKKSQTFKSYLKQKVTQLRKQRQIQNIRNQNYDRQLPQYQSIDKMPSTNKQYQQPKPFNKKKLGNSKSHNQSYPKSNNIQTESQQNPSYRANQSRENQQNNLVYAPNNIENPSGAHSTNTRQNFKKKLQKNTIRDIKKIQVPQIKGINQSTQPASKQSFRIKAIVPPRKLKQQLIKLNQQQKKIQLQLFNLHNSTKDQVDQMKHKYDIRSNGQIMKDISVRFSSQKSLQNDLQYPSSPNINSQNPLFQKQKQKCDKIYKQLSKMNHFIQKKKLKIKQCQKKIQSSPLLTYLNQNDDIFQERQSQQQAESVQQLPQQIQDIQSNQKVMGKTYQKVMGEIKKKKWGLTKRFQYDLVKPSVMGQSKMSKIKNGKYDQQIIVEEQQHDKKDNKVTVNPRLKDLLFD